jgi:RNA polymerase sigma factor (sigma-70 family)
MSETTATRGGSTFPTRCSVVVMDPSRSTATASGGAEALFSSFVQGERGGKLRSQLESLHREASAEEIEDAIQTACDRFVDKAEGISAPGQVYAWIRTTAHRVLSREEDHRLWELPVDPTDVSLQELAAEEPGPEEETIEHEDEAELVALVHEVADSLPDRKREILALHSAGYKRPEIASRLGLSERAIKRDLLEIMDEARAVIASKAGGGCLWGEPMVLRFAYGLASAGEAEQARRHMSGCRRCEVLWERLDAWREKAAALLPVPAADQASPGFIERLAHRAADVVVSAKQQVFGTAAQAKQQVATSYYRAVDPTPLSGARPGAVAALLVSCVTIGGGAATYCAQQNVNPLRAASDLIAGEEEESKPSAGAPVEPPESTAVVPPAPAPATEEPVASEPASPVEAEPQPAHEPAPPPPEQSFEPASPDYPATEAEAEYQASESAPSESARPAPVSGGGAPQFGGP